MKMAFLFGMIAAFVLVGGCGGGSGGDDAGGGGGGGGGGDGTTIASGSQAMFSVIRSSSSDTMNIGGTSITLSEGTSYIYRYVFDQLLDRLDSTLNMTNNYSCDNAGTQEPITVSTSLFNAELCPDIDDSMVTIDLERFDPSTKTQIGSACTFVQSGTQRNFAIVGDEIFYRKSSNGALVKRTLSTCSAETELLDLNDPGNTYRHYFYGIGSSLLSIYAAVDEPYVINHLDTSTGAILETYPALAYDLVGTWNGFFEGDDALYWWLDAGAVLQVYRYVPGGQADVALSVSSDAAINNNSVAIDASGGKIFFAYKDGTSASTFDLVIAPAATGTAETQLADLDSTFFKTYMQYYVFP